MRDMHDVVVVVPIYKPQLSALEAYSLSYSLKKLNGRDICFIGPDGLNVDYYIREYSDAKFLGCDRKYFASVQGYSDFLLNRAFYDLFNAYDFLLVLQTDAIVLNGDLSCWIDGGFDYVGAPWPGGMSQLVNFDKFTGEGAIQIKSHVGNGGLSLRRVSRCISLLEEFPAAVQIYKEHAFNEDCYFAIMGALSQNFKIPDQATAALFSLEMSPRHYWGLTKRNPSGGHAWWKYDVLFWLERLNPLPPKAVVLDFLKNEGRYADLASVSQFYEAQSNKVIENKVLHMDTKSVEIFLDSHLEYRGLPIQVTASKEEHDRLFLRIKNQWADYGASEPYASVLSDEKFLMATVQENMLEFNASGGEAVAWMKLLAARNGVVIPAGSCFELGCGVGRITKHLAGNFEKVLAADISPGNLAVCSKYLEESGVGNVEIALLEGPHGIDGLPGFDVFFSVMVLQHNPPPIQYYLLDKIFGKLSAGGICFFQTATYNPGYSYSVGYQLGLGEDDFRRWSLHCLPMRCITQLLDKHGLGLCEVVQDKMAGGLAAKFHSHTFFAIKK
jgi:2-polyprenyl-3-methyl-5-hydroxy-6-metoxy-1,4-benzoquinol methylase